MVVDYLEDAGLLPYLEALGFHVAGFGCTTCIGNSGPLHPDIEKAIADNDLNVVSVLSGNRNFEARIHQSVKGNYLASPMLVVAFAIAGRIDINLNTEPVGFDPNNDPVYLEDIWPSDDQIRDLVQKHVKQEFFRKEYDKIFDGDQFWQDLDVTKSTTFTWDDQSTYIKNPRILKIFKWKQTSPVIFQRQMYSFYMGDSVTTDHISPAGAISREYPAGKYLIQNKVKPEEFNSYGARRGNHEVMMRGTFGNIRIKNQMAGSGKAVLL